MSELPARIRVVRYESELWPEFSILLLSGRVALGGGSVGGSNMRWSAEGRRSARRMPSGEAAAQVAVGTAVAIWGP